MKEQATNKYKSAGVWNIVCAVIYTIVYISVFFLICMEIMDLPGADGVITHPIEFIGLLFAVLGVVFVSGVGILLWVFFMLIPAALILTATEMLSKRKKGAGVKAWIVFNTLIKLFSAYLNVYAGVQFIFLTGGGSLLVTLASVILIATAILFLVSVVMDYRALFKREGIETEKIK